MIIGDRIRDEKLQYDVKQNAEKISTLSCGKIGKYEYFTDEKMLPSNQKQTIKQAKFANSPFGKTLEKQTEQQVGVLKSLDLPNEKDESN